MIGKTIIYPNPTNGIVTVQLQEMEVLSYSIYDYNGQVIKRKQVESPEVLKIDFREISTGVYFVSFTDGVNSRTIKVLKK